MDSLKLKRNVVLKSMETTLEFSRKARTFEKDALLSSFHAIGVKTARDLSQRKGLGESLKIWRTSR